MKIVKTKTFLDALDNVLEYISVAHSNAKITFCKQSSF